MSEPIVRIENLSKSFGDNRVIRDVSLEVERGEILTLIGKSGVGKSVLLKLMIDILEPDAGRILFEGRPLGAMKRAERDAFRRKMSYVFQGTALLDSLTVLENVALPLAERGGMAREEIRRRAREKMLQLDLAGIDASYPSQLSGGMKKRVALARALVTDPEIVLFDEPTTGLDPIRKHAVHALITDYQRKFGFTAVLVSHEIPDVFYISQRIAMLDEGRITFVGTPEALQRSADPVIRQFIAAVAAPAKEQTALAHPADLENHISRELARPRPGPTAFTLVSLTLDNLGEVNNHFGYTAGQNAMKNLLRRVRSQLRVTDSASRVGLNRVLVTLSGASLEEGTAFSAKLGEALRRHEILPGAGELDFCLLISAGLAEATRDSRLEDLVAAAEAGRDSLEKFKACRLAEER